MATKQLSFRNSFPKLKNLTTVQVPYFPGINPCPHYLKKVITKSFSPTYIESCNLMN